MLHLDGFPRADGAVEDALVDVGLAVGGAHRAVLLGAGACAFKTIQFAYIYLFIYLSQGTLT